MGKESKREEITINELKNGVILLQTVVTRTEEEVFRDLQEARNSKEFKSQFLFFSAFAPLAVGLSSIFGGLVFVVKVWPKKIQ